MIDCMLNVAVGVAGIPLVRDIPNSRQTSLMAYPRSPATKRKRSSIMELSFHGIDTFPLRSQGKVSTMSPERFVSYVSDRTLDGLARPEGFEPPTRSLEGCRSIRLS